MLWMFQPFQICLETIQSLRRKVPKKMFWFFLNVVKHFRIVWHSKLFQNFQICLESFHSVLKNCLHEKFPINVDKHFRIFRMFETFKICLQIKQFRLFQNISICSGEMLNWKFHKKVSKHETIQNVYNKMFK